MSKKYSTVLVMGRILNERTSTAGRSLKYRQMQIIFPA